MPPLESVAVTVTVSLPLVEYIVEKLAPEPIAGVPLGADHVNVKPPVPPVAEAVQSTGLATVADEQFIVTAIEGATVRLKLEKLAA